VPVYHIPNMLNVLLTVSAKQSILSACEAVGQPCPITLVNSFSSTNITNSKLL